MNITSISYTPNRSTKKSKLRGGGIVTYNRALSVMGVKLIDRNGSEPTAVMPSTEKEEPCVACNEPDPITGKFCIHCGIEKPEREIKLGKGKNEDYVSFAELVSRDARRELEDKLRLVDKETERTSAPTYAVWNGNGTPILSDQPFTDPPELTSCTLSAFRIERVVGQPDDRGWLPRAIAHLRFGETLRLYDMRLEQGASRWKLKMPQKPRKSPCYSCKASVPREAEFCGCCGKTLPPKNEISREDAFHPIQNSVRSRLTDLLLNEFMGMGPETTCIEKQVSYEVGKGAAGT
jgi:DNA-binding cell septation regulator SpoVG